MNYWQFVADHPVLAVIVTYLLFSPVRYAYKAYRRKIQHQNIAVSGWPPTHLDADGDAIPFAKANKAADLRKQQAENWRNIALNLQSVIQNLIKVHDMEVSGDVRSTIVAKARAIAKADLNIDTK